ncbi:MAG: RluA family pseudouridine synthase [Acidobacteria bacterium]|nr:RluA family pseudouridine synthase [Acidobacteriota bacterium]
MQEWIVDDADADVRLDLWLVRRAGAASRAKAAAWLERGKVFLGDRPAGRSDAAHRLRPGQRVGLWIDRPGSAKAADRQVYDIQDLLHIVHEDPDFLVVDKPVGLIVEPLPGRVGEETTLLDLLVAYYHHDVRAQLYVVHRIDRHTSGLVLFARTAAARDALKDQFENRTPMRIYQAVLLGRVTPEQGRWTDRLAWDAESYRQRRAHGTDARGKDAIADYVVREQFAEAALVEVSLVTGKRNQIRVQAGLRGHPLLGERQYRFDSPPEPPDLPRIDRQALHAWRLGFSHPATGRQTEVETQPPEDLLQLLKALRRSGRA